MSIEFYSDDFMEMTVEQVPWRGRIPWKRVVVAAGVAAFAAFAWGVKKLA